MREVVIYKIYKEKLLEREREGARSERGGVIYIYIYIYIYIFRERDREREDECIVHACVLHMHIVHVCRTVILVYILVYCVRV